MEMLLAEAQKQLTTGGDALVPEALECQPCAEPTPPDGLAGTRAALDTIEKEASLLGMQLHPLRSLDELAVVLETQLVFPEGTPRRARRVLEELRLRGVNLSTEFELTQLVERLEASDGWAAALGKLRVPSERRVVLVPPVTRCVVPGCQGGRLVHARYGRSTCPHVFSIDGQLQAELCGRICVDCHAVHCMSFASGGNLLPQSKQLFYEDAASLRWFQSTHGTVFEKRLLDQLNVQMLHSHSGWETFAHEYAMLHGAVTDHFRKVLAHAWLEWSLLDWAAALRAPLGAVDLCSEEGLDAVLLDHHEMLLAAFVGKWGTEHPKFCRQPETCNTNILDGHFKCRRVVCAWSRARVVHVPGLGKVVLGCLGTPILGSRFCKAHSARSACRSGITSEPDETSEPDVTSADYQLPDDAPVQQLDGWLPPAGCGMSLPAAERAERRRKGAEASPPVAADAAATEPTAPATAEPPPPATTASKPAPLAAAAAEPVPTAAVPPAAPPPPVTKRGAAPTRRSSRVAERIAASAAAAQQQQEEAPPPLPTVADEDDGGELDTVAAPTWELKQLLQHRVLTKSFARALGAEHEGCVGAGMRVFKVDWLPPWKPTWECECNIGLPWLEEYDAARAAAREEHAAVAAAKKQRAADAADAAGAAATVAEEARELERSARDERAAKRALRSSEEAQVVPPDQEHTGDFLHGVDEMREFDLKIGCNNLKEEQRKKKGAISSTHVPKASTAGVLALVSSCGLFLAIKEMTGSESLQQVHLFLYEVFTRDGLPVPQVLCYDDACHLLMYLYNRVNQAEKYGYSKFAYWLLYTKQLAICCDRFHFPNHADVPFCNLYVDPAKCKPLGKRTNTMSAEEARVPHHPLSSRRPSQPARARGRDSLASSHVHSPLHG